jgi:energy-coupling factor transporter transmembrane protein EcfT
MVSDIIIILIAAFSAALVSFILAIYIDRRYFYIVFILLGITIIVLIIWLLYTLNQNNKNLNEDLNNNMNIIGSDLSIIDTYLREISPGIEMGNQNQEEITYPGITLL